MTASEKIHYFRQIDFKQVVRSAQNPQQELENIISEIESILTEIKATIRELKEQQNRCKTELETIIASFQDSAFQSYEDTALERKDQFTLEKIRKAKQLRIEQQRNLEYQLNIIQENIDWFYRDRNSLEQQLLEARSYYEQLRQQREKKYLFRSWLKNIQNWKPSFPKLKQFQQKTKPLKQKRSTKENNGVFILIIINLIIFVFDHAFNLKLIDQLYLDHDHMAWYQLITAMFCHANWHHLSSNLFFLYLFGRLVEEEEGAKGLIMSYLICGFGANIMSLIFQPSYVVSLGASGAIFGLFTVSVLLKLGWHWRRLIEVIILGQFVLQQVLFELQNLDRIDGINRVAHLGGALIGVLLIWGLKRWQKRRELPES